MSSMRHHLNEQRIDSGYLIMVMAKLYVLHTTIKVQFSSFQIEFTQFHFE